MSEEIIITTTFTPEDLVEEEEELDVKTDTPGPLLRQVQGPPRLFTNEQPETSFINKVVTYIVYAISTVVGLFMLYLICMAIYDWWIGNTYRPLTYDLGPTLTSIGFSL